MTSIVRIAVPDWSGIMSEEIKPCPCCGSTNVHAYNSKSAQYRQYSIKCMKCGLRVCKATLMEAKEVWNRRVTPEVKTQYIAVELDGLKSKTVG